MNYLITANEMNPFLTNWYDYENHYRDDLNMVVYDLIKCIYTTDGKTWFSIVEDHL